MSNSGLKQKLYLLSQVSQLNMECQIYLMDISQQKGSNTITISKGKKLLVFMI